MSEVNFTEVLDLLTRANNKGISLSWVDESLYYNLKGDMTIDDDLLQELKKNKGQLIEYFRKKENGSEMANKKDLRADKIEMDGRYYYHVTPTQLYWLDDGRDSEFKENDDAHGRVTITHAIEGTLDLDVFNKSVAFVIDRHESLRVTFHKIEGTFYLRVEPPDPAFHSPEYIDLTSPSTDRNESLEELTRFSGHTFSFCNGPLTVFRLIRTETDKHILSIRLHHVIVDQWSLEILMRDLLIAYSNYMLDKKPALDVLPCQYKECLALINNYSAKNYAEHKKYWLGIYNGWPEELLLPGVVRKQTDITKRPLKAIRTAVPDKLVEKLTLTATSASTSLFVVLQSIVKLFLLRKTGQRDIVIGTYIFGRELDHNLFDDQIGCYAKTTVIRTFLDPDDDFPAALQKVKRSNDDLRNYNACMLIDALREFPVEDHRKSLYPWNINLLFEDMNRSHLNTPEALQARTGSSLSMERLPEPVTNSLAHIDLQLVFVSDKKKMEILVLYDGSLYDESTINDFMSECSEFADNSIKTS